MKLSEIFSIPDADPSLELKAVMLNINKSSSIRAKSSARYQYQSLSLFLYTRQADSCNGGRKRRFMIIKIKYLELCEYCEYGRINTKIKELSQLRRGKERG